MLYLISYRPFPAIVLMFESCLEMCLCSLDPMITGCKWAGSTCNIGDTIAEASAGCGSHQGNSGQLLIALGYGSTSPPALGKSKHARVMKTQTSDWWSGTKLCILKYPTQSLGRSWCAFRSDKQACQMMWAEQTASSWKAHTCSKLSKLRMSVHQAKGHFTPPSIGVHYTRGYQLHPS